MIAIRPSLKRNGRKKKDSSVSLNNISIAFPSGLGRGVVIILLLEYSYPLGSLAIFSSENVNILSAKYKCSICGV